MKVELDIKDNKAVAFLNFIRSLDFITINKPDKTQKDTIEKLPEALQSILLQSEEDIQAGRLLSHDEVMRSL